MKVTVTRRNDIDLTLSKINNMRIVIAPANATNLTEYSEINIKHIVGWDSSNPTKMVFNINFIQYENGLYKVGFIRNT
jgi:hypothetical protein